jgi:hypothetical protein
MRSGDFRGKKRVSTQEKSDFAISLWFSKRKYQSCEQRLAFVFRSPARALAASLPLQDHVYKTTDESFRFHSKNFDEMRCKLDSTENSRSFEKYPTSP